MSHFEKIALELGVTQKQVIATISLLDAGGTVPFIARYRKEQTDSLDEVQIAAIRDRMIQLLELDKRRDAILKSLTELGKLDDALKEKVMSAETLTALEDIYLPYRPKRKTRATAAREKGLEPLALTIFDQNKFDLEAEAAKYIDTEKGVATFEEALQGARDIIAEMVNENPEARAKVRTLFLEKGTVKTRVIPGKEEAAAKYKDYFEWEESVKNAPSHRVLAMRRGEKELFLMMDVLPQEEDAIVILEEQFVTGRGDASTQVKIAIEDSYKRLLRPSMETDVRMLTKIKADEDAIKVFVENARQLLLAAPLGQKTVLAIDPGFRTGCKVVVLDAQGNLKENTNIYPHEKNKVAESAALIKHLVEKYKVEAIAIGNGTAGRESEEFVKSLQIPNVLVVMVNESGASIYSASEVAREEFGDYDVTVRGSVSIGRRLMDPLAELVKIDPKSIGVGQYQHDVDQTKLQQSLDDVVISCVNGVGVELNTASKQLLSYVSGLGASLAQNIVEHRKKNGPFRTRKELLKVARLGDKAFEQAAGFLRISDAENPLDKSAVHPESYPIVEKMAKDLGCSVADLMTKDELRKQIKLQAYVTDKVGLPTLNDIVKELAKPGRDPREKFDAFSFTDGVNSIADLRIGMKLPGIVTNVTNFGAFVDIGVHQDGLVHISHLSDTFVSNPADVLKVQQKVEVTVLEIDVARKRIALSMKSNGAAAPKGKTEGGENVKRAAASMAPRNTAPKKEEPEMDMAAKLAALKSMFK